MKILKVNYVSGQALFVLEGFPKQTFCIDLKGKTTAKQVTDELKAKIPQPDTTENIYNNLNLKSLEGSNL